MTMGGQLVRLVAQMITLIVLARLLDPADFGLVAMVTAIVGVGELIRDLGLSNASIQAKTLSNQQRSNLFWMSTGIGLLVGGVVAIAAPLIASFYGQEALAAIALALASTFLINGMAAQHKASLARALRFRGLAIVETTPPIVAGVLAIWLAATGWSYWALVAQQITQAGLGLILVLIAARWLPGLPRRTEGMLPLITYGLNLLGAQVVAYFSRNIDTVVIGLRFGATPVGFYTRAFELIMNPLNQINAPSTRVAVPILSRLQDDTARYDAFLLRGQKVLLVALLPVVGLVAATAEPLIDLLLGPGWDEVVPLLQVLAVAGGLRVAAYATYWVALSRGLTRVSLYVNLSAAPVYAVFVLLGSLAGVVGVAVGFAAATLATWAISLVWYSKAAHVPGWRLFNSAGRAIMFVVPASLAAWLSVQSSEPLGDALSLLIGGLGFVAAYALTAVIVRPMRRDLREAYSVVHHLRSR